MAVLKVKKLDESQKHLVTEKFPSFHYKGSVKGMRKQYGANCLLVKCGKWIYNVESQPDIYYKSAR